MHLSEYLKNKKNYTIDCFTDDYIIKFITKSVDKKSFFYNLNFNYERIRYMIEINHHILIKFLKKDL